MWGGVLQSFWRGRQHFHEGSRSAIPPSVAGAIDRRWTDVLGSPNKVESPSDPEELHRRPVGGCLSTLAGVLGDPPPPWTSYVETIGCTPLGGSFVTRVQGSRIPRLASTRQGTVGGVALDAT